MLDTRTYTFKALSTRDARQRLFTIDTPESDKLRHKLFDVEGQDDPISSQHQDEFDAVLVNWLNDV